jgi:DNA primase
MNTINQMISLDEARQIDLVDYLSKLGHAPSKIRASDYWYLSPLCNEKTPSFKINRKLNCWYDHGIGKGGNLIDFAILYHNYTVGEFLKEINGHFSFHQPVSVSQKEYHENAESKVAIINEKTISSLALERYLTQRRISIDIAREYCKEITYQINGKDYFGIGFKNDAGGYELRNQYYKSSSSPKDIKTFSFGANEAVVFEGFFDFLSFIVMQRNLPQIKADFVVLNSVSFFEKARSFMEQHENIRLYLDRDKTGQNYSRYALSLSNKYKDESELYKNHKDLNDWMMNIGKVQKRSLDHSLPKVFSFISLIQVSQGHQIT